MFQIQNIPGDFGELEPLSKTGSELSGILCSIIKKLNHLPDYPQTVKSDLNWCSASILFGTIIMINAYT